MKCAIKEFTKRKDERRGWQFTASTMYERDGFRIWKGKYKVISVIYSANEWHLERLADHKMIFSAKTAKACAEYYFNFIQ